jgi:hypothetical protein
LETIAAIRHWVKKLTADFFNGSLAGDFSGDPADRQTRRWIHLEGHRAISPGTNRLAVLLREPAFSSWLPCLRRHLPGLVPKRRENIRLKRLKDL